MNINKETYEKLLNQWYAVADIVLGCDMDNIREVFGNMITNDTGEFIDVNFKDILVTFKADMRMYQEYGGKAVLLPNFEYYDKNGQFVGYYDLIGNEI